MKPQFHGELTTIQFGAALPMSVVWPIVVLFVVCLYSGFRLPLGPLLCFITLFFIICSSVWCFTNAARFDGDILWKECLLTIASHYEHSNFSVNPLMATFYERSVYWPLHHTMNTPISVLTHWWRHFMKGVFTDHCITLWTLQFQC